MANKSFDGYTLLAPAVVFLCFVFVYPLIQVVWGSFFYGGFSFNGYARIWAVPVYRQVIGTTFRIALFSTGICIVLGYVVAYFISSTHGVLRRVLTAAVVIPLILNVLVRNYVWIILLQRNGPVDHLLSAFGVAGDSRELLHSESAVMIGMVSSLLPYMILSTLASLLAIPEQLRHASTSLGSSPIRTFRRVTLPLSLPGAAAGGLIVFIISVGFYITPALLGGRRDLMISNVIAFNVNETLNWKLAFALGTILLVCTVTAYGAYASWLKKKLISHGRLSY